MFVIDTKLSKQEGLLTLRIKSPQGFYAIDDSKRASLSSNPLLEKLYLEEKKLNPHQNRFDFFRVSPGSTRSILEKLAATGNLYIDNAKAIVDFFSKLEVQVEALLDAGDVLLEATVKQHEKTQALSSYDCFIRSRPQIAIKAPFIYFFHDDVAWDDLMTLSKSALSLQHFTRWKDETSLLWNLIHETKEPAKPLLAIQDARGLFCNALLQENGTTKPLPGGSFEKQLLYAGYQYKPVGSSSYFCPQDKVMKALEYLLENGWFIQDCSGRRLHILTECSLEHELQDDRIVIQGRIRANDLEGDVRSYIQALKQENTLIPLGKNDVGLIRHTDHAILAQAIEFVSDRATLKKKLIGLVDENPFLQRIAIDPIDNKGRFEGTLRPYQQEGVSWLLALARQGFGGCLADDMGLGKTIQAICFLSHLPKHALHLIVAPTSLLINWQREIKRFFPSCSIYCHHGNERNIAAWPQQGIVLTTYGTLRQDVAIFSKKMFTCCILDEAQSIKNEASDTAQAVYKLQSSCVITMTGTPIENNPKELFSQFKATVPGLISKDEVEGSVDLFVHQRLKKKIKPFILRRKKEEVAKDLPELIEQTIYVELAVDEYEQYVQAQKSLQTGLVAKKTLSDASTKRIEVLEAILRLRQLVSHPLLVEQLATRNVCTSTKFELVLSDIETLVQEGNKILVFSQFAKLIALLEKELQRRNILSLVLDGQTKNRQEVVDQFQQGSEQVLLMTMKAGGVGLNLTAADAILLYDPWWNEAQEAQAISRAHRIGRTKACLVKRYIAVGTIEEQMQQLQREKKQLEDAFLE